MGHVYPRYVLLDSVIRICRMMLKKSMQTTYLSGIGYGLLYTVICVGKSVNQQVAGPSSAGTGVEGGIPTFG